jgi:hypothetical protein
MQRTEIVLFLYQVRFFSPNLLGWKATLAARIHLSACSNHLRQVHLAQS